MSLEKLEQLKNGTISLWDSDSQKSLPSALNPLLRTYYNENLGQPVKIYATLNSLAPYNHNDLQVDHFLEIQHVIRLILLHPNINTNEVCNVPIGDFLRLSRFLNHEYNLYSIPAAENNYKSRIGIELYVAKSSTFIEEEGDAEKRKFIQDYLRANLDENENHQLTTVENRIMTLLNAMKNATGDYRALCNIAGEVLLDFFLNGSQSLKDKIDAGAFQKH